MPWALRVTYTAEDRKMKEEIGPALAAISTSRGLAGAFALQNAQMHGSHLPLWAVSSLRACSAAWQEESWAEASGMPSCPSLFHRPAVCCWEEGKLIERCLQAVCFNHQAGTSVSCALGHHPSGCKSRPLPSTAVKAVCKSSVLKFSWKKTKRFQTFPAFSIFLLSIYEARFSPPQICQELQSHIAWR